MEEENLKENEEHTFAMSEDSESESEGPKTNYKRLIFPIIAFSLPLIIVIVFGIIIFANKYQLDMKGKFTGSLIAWILLAINGTIISAIFLPLTLVKWRKGNSKAPTIAGSIVSFLDVVAIAIGVLLVKDVKPNFLASKMIEMNVKQKTFDGSKIYLTIDFKNTTDCAFASLKGELIFYHKAKQTTFTISEVNFPSTSKKDDKDYYTFKANESFTGRVYFTCYESDVQTSPLTSFKIELKLKSLKKGLSTKTINEAPVCIYD